MQVGFELSQTMHDTHQRIKIIPRLVRIDNLNIVLVMLAAVPGDRSPKVQRCTTIGTADIRKTPVLTIP